MAVFLFKTEPGDFAFDDLPVKGEALWDGVTNAAALIHLRACRAGDEVFIYHTGEEKAVVGEARIVTGPREDPKKPGTTTRGEPKFAVVGLVRGAAFKTPVSLAAIKSDPAFASFSLVKIGRLSVMPVPAPLATRIRAMGRA